MPLGSYTAPTHMIGWYNIMEMLSCPASHDSKLAWISLSRLSLGTRSHENAWDIFQKNQQHHKICTFRHPESGPENSIWIHRRTENNEIRWFCKKTRIANHQIAAISNRSDFKSRDADLKSRDAGQLSYWERYAQPMLRIGKDREGTALTKRLSLWPTLWSVSQVQNTEGLRFEKR